MLKLVRLERWHLPLLIDMMDEWTQAESSITPWSIWKNGQMNYRDYDAYVSQLEFAQTNERWVKDSVLFALDEERNRLIGAVNIRHELNEYLLLHGGHIGDGVRPSERGKGYGTRIVRLALEKCLELGIDRVLMGCDKENIPSARTIIKNGGVLENEVVTEDGIEQRYWIDLT